MKLLSIAFVSILAACGGSKPATKTGDTTAAITAPSGTALGLAELKFSDKHGVRLQVHANGTIEMEAKKADQPAGWEQVGTIGTDGSVTSKDGKKGQLQADGSFKTSEGKDAGFKLDGESLVMGDKKLTLGADGGLLLNGQPIADADMKIEGATDTGTRRTALLVVGLLMGAEQSSGPAPSATVTAPAPTPAH